MTQRVTGLVSGLDTETIIKQLMSGHQAKVDTAQKEQTKLKWKQEAWASLNTKLYNFYKGALNKFQSVGTYKAKKVEASNTSKIKISNSNNAVTGSHTLSVKQTASAAYLTGKSLRGQSFKTTSYKAAADASVQVSDLKDSKGYSIDLDGKSFDISYVEKDADGNEQTITKTITAQAGADGTLQSLIDNMNQSLADEGIKMTVSYDAAQGGLKFVNETAEPEKDVDGAITGYKNGVDYTLKAADSSAAKALGISDKGVTVGQQLTDKGENVAIMGNAFNVANVSDTEAAITGGTKLTDMGIASGTKFSLTVGKGADAKTYDLTIDQSTTLNSLASQFSKMGVKANFDEKQGRFFITSTESGEAYDFELTSDDADALAKLGLDSASSTKVDAQDAIVVYNGATFQQSSNNFSLNGLNFTVNDVTIKKDADGNEIDDEPIKLTVSTDTDAIYNAVKDFIKEYNSLIDEMNKLYRADRAKGYDPLTSDEKQALSDKEVEEWEKKIKDSLLRQDSKVSSLLTNMRSTLGKSINYTNAEGITKRYSLASFGITTGKWNEYGKLHIAGDSEDAEYADMDDKLRAAIENDPDALIATLSGIGKDLYSNMQKAMKATNYSSPQTFYDDVTMKDQIKDYDSKIKKLQEKFNKAEDRYYKQFAKMEAAMAKVQANGSSISGLFGN